MPVPVTVQKLYVIRTRIGGAVRPTRLPLSLVCSVVLFAGSATAQRITEFPIPTAGSYPGGIALGKSGTLWFTETTGNKIGKITADGVITEFPLLGPGRQPLGITRGSDGNMWFAQYGNNSIGRITNGGTVTEFLAAGNPSAITSGRDGALYFLQSSAAKIGRMTTAGVFTEMATLGNAFTYALTLGLDGALWYTAYSTNQIVSLDPVTGAHNGYPVAAGGGLRGIAYTSDGAVWAVEQNNPNTVYRMPWSGDPAHFAVPTPFAYLTELIAGPHDEVWMIEQAANKVARITAAGVVTEYTLPTAASAPIAMAFGPDGNLWIAETTGNKIARLVPERAGDTNGDGLVSVLDVFHLINFLFGGGPAPKF